MTTFDVEIGALSNLELSSLCGGYKYSVYSGKTVVIEGHCGIFSFYKEQIVFKIKKAFLCVKGSALVIHSLTRNFAVVCGIIDSVEVKENVG